VPDVTASTPHTTSPTEHFHAIDDMRR
jgi:hypothetical protein